MKKVKFYYMLVIISIFILSLSLTVLSQKVPIRIGAGATGGGWFPTMTATMVVVNDNVPEVISTVVPGGAIVNVTRINTGQLDIALTYTNTAYCAQQGLPPFEEKHENYLAIGNYPKYPYAYYVPADSDIFSIKDLSNKRILAGTKGSGTEADVARMLAEYGITYDSIIKNGGQVQFIGFSEGVMLMKDRHVDMSIGDKLSPDPHIVEIEMTFPCRVLNIENEILDHFIEKYYPGYSKYFIPKGTYKGQKEDATTIAYGHTLIVRKDLPEDLVYKITKAIYENPDELAKGYKDLAEINPEMAVDGVPIAFHPGAEKYFREIGVIK